MLLVLVISMMAAGEQSMCGNSSLSVADPFTPLHCVGTGELLLRRGRDSHSLIGPFDLSKMFKRRRPTDRTEDVARLGPAPLQAAPRLDPPPTQESTSFPAHKDNPQPSSSAIPRNSKSEVISGQSHVALKQKPQIKSLRKSISSSESASSKPADARTERRHEDWLTPGKKISLELRAWPVKRAAVVEGDIVLGGLMMVSATLTPSTLFCYDKTTQEILFHTGEPVPIRAIYLL